MNALGLIEVYSFTTALCAADVMAKAADVKIIAFDRNRPFGKNIPVPLIMVVKVEGSVAAVKAAIEAGTQYAQSKGRYIVSHIIPRPDEDAEKMAYLMDMNKDKFMGMSLYNIAKAGIFSADRSVMEYADNIWKM